VVVDEWNPPPPPPIPTPRPLLQQPEWEMTTEDLKTLSDLTPSLYDEGVCRRFRSQSF